MAEPRDGLRAVVMQPIGIMPPAPDEATLALELELAVEAPPEPATVTLVLAAAGVPVSPLPPHAEDDSIPVAAEPARIAQVTPSGIRAEFAQKDPL